jgi:hypothetical protein
LNDVTETLVRKQHFEVAKYSEEKPKLLIRIILSMWINNPSMSESELAFKTVGILQSQRTSRSQYTAEIRKDLSRMMDALYSIAEGALKNQIIKGVALWVSS